MRLAIPDLMDQFEKICAGFTSFDGQREQFQHWEEGFFYADESYNEKFKVFRNGVEFGFYCGRLPG